MKILVVNTTPSRRNGITNVALNLIKSFDKQGVEFGYVSISDMAKEIEAYLKEAGVKVYVVKRSIKRPITYIKQLAKIANGYDIVYVHGNSATMVLEMIAAKIAGVKVRAAHSHNTSCSMKKIDACSRPLFHALCNLRLACGKEAGKWLYGKRDFNIINNGIDCRRFIYNENIRNEVRKDLGWSDNFIIANVANFVAAKNHEFLINTFAGIHDKKSNVRLLLLGAGPLMDDVIAQTKEMGIYDCVKFIGNVPNIETYLQSIDFIVMPSKFEGLPLTLIEEQANGLSAVVSDTITKDVDITGNIKFLPLGKGAEFWSSYIVSMIENGIERGEIISNESIKKIKDAGYDISTSSKKLKELFLETLNEYHS